jgi:hypothetical protein
LGFFFDAVTVVGASVSATFLLYGAWLFVQLRLAGRWQTGRLADLVVSPHWSKRAI